MIEPALFARLSTWPGLTALVSTRVYPNAAPQNAAVPYVTYRRVSTVRDSAFVADVGTAQARMQLDVFATTYAGSRAVAEQVRAALQRWTAPNGTPPIDATFIETEADLYEPDPIPPLHHAVVDVLIHYREA